MRHIAARVRQWFRDVVHNHIINLDTAPAPKNSAYIKGSLLTRMWLWRIQLRPQSSWVIFFALRDYANERALWNGSITFTLRDFVTWLTSDERETFYVSHPMVKTIRALSREEARVFMEWLLKELQWCGFVVSYKARHGLAARVMFSPRFERYCRLYRSGVDIDDIVTQSYRLFDKIEAYQAVRIEMKVSASVESDSLRQEASINH